MVQVVLENISKRFGTMPVLSDVSLKIENGSFVAFVGPSGCGKSTLLRVIAGLESADSGDILFSDKRMNDVPAPDRGAAMVFQSYALYPHMSVWENMSFSLRLKGMNKDARRARARDVASLLQLTDYLDRRPAALSGGQRQRVAIGRAILRRPDVFLFDEPLSNLDAALRTEMRVELARLHQQIGNTMIYVTHDQVEAMTMADKIVVLKDGRVAQAGAPMALYSRPATRFVAEFIGSPKMNLFDGTVDRVTDTGIDVAFPDGARIALPHRGPAMGASVTLGFRPEALRLDVAPGEESLPVRVEVVERLGAEALVYCQGTLPGRVLVKTDGMTALRPGDRIDIGPDPAAAHLFDREGLRICSPGPCDKG